ncbi:MmcQ/YjbR family DNA-binding protein [Companilactobacillus sp. DQM5]|uniref:MmcQ/YjbR family DNA-binding protein n=1 Tax=Companilactobacillus sp. DQM5 TaxID=3463359 RepID=UPI00405928CC
MKKVNFDKLLKYGFKKTDEKYIYKINIFDNQFELTININDKGDIKTRMIDNTTQEEYVLHLDESIQGEFVGQVRSDYEKVIEDIEDKCFDKEVFQSNQTKQIIDYITKKYNDEIEFLWEKFPNNAIFRRKDTKKWYAGILTVKPEKIGLKGTQPLEVIDLHVENIEVIDNQKIFPGYHMNKKHWISIVLDERSDNQEIIKFITKSYELANKK